jgi:hypothetical protein
MTTMQCHEFERALEQQDARELPADAAAHLNDCVHCQALVADLDAIEAAARQMSLEVEPPERVWQSLRAQLAAEGLIGAEEKVARGGWLAGWLAVFPRPALAGVYLSLLLAAAVLISLQVSRGPVVDSGAKAAQQATDVLNSQLNTVERHTVSAMHRRDPAVTASLQQNLDIVDNAIALCEKSVREDPQSALAREYLYGAYQQKAELLAAMMDRGPMGDE